MCLSVDMCMCEQVYACVPVCVMCIRVCDHVCICASVRVSMCMHVCLCVHVAHACVCMHPGSLMVAGRPVCHVLLRQEEDGPPRVK